MPDQIPAEVYKAAARAMLPFDEAEDEADYFEWHHCTDQPNCTVPTGIPCACSGIPWPSPAVRAAVDVAYSAGVAAGRAQAAADIRAQREQLAAIEHERWAHWQGWMHRASVANVDGSLSIPTDLVERWERQIATPYAELSEAEKRSDREQVDRYLPLIIVAAQGDDPQ